MYKSTDQGATWTFVGLANATVLATVVDPVTPTSLYVGTVSDGVYRSPDAGATWIAAGLAGATVADLEIDNGAPNTIFAVAFGSDATRSVVKTTDAGLTWNETSLETPTARALAILPGNPSALFAGTQDGVYRSADGGEHWQATTLTAPVSSIVIEAGPPATLYATTDDGTLLASRDEGANWFDSGLTGLDVGAAIAPDPNHPASAYVGAYFAGIFATADRGVSWTTTGFTPAEGIVLCLATIPGAEGMIYAGTGSGLLKSADGGSSWSFSGGGIRNTFIQDVAVDPKNTANIYTATSDAILRTVDGGQNWIGIDLVHPTSLAVDPQNSATIYAGLTGGLFRSVDGGENWTKVGTGFDAPMNVRTIAIDPAAPATLYVSDEWAGVLKSTDAGATWSNHGQFPDPIDVIVVDPLDSMNLYAGSAKGLFASHDAGQNWMPIASGTPAIDLTDATAIYVAGKSGVRKLERATSTWTEIGPAEAVLSLAVDPDAPDTIYAGTLHGVFRTTDGGSKWVEISTGLTNTRVTSLRLTPANTLYAGTDGGGLYVLSVD